MLNNNWEMPWTDHSTMEWGFKNQTFPTRPNLPLNNYPDVTGPFNRVKTNLYDAVAMNQNTTQTGGAMNKLRDHFAPGGYWDVSSHCDLPGYDNYGRPEYGRVNNNVMSASQMSHQLFGLGLGASQHYPDFIQPNNYEKTYKRTFASSLIPSNLSNPDWILQGYNAITGSNATLIKSMNVDSSGDDPTGPVLKGHISKSPTDDDPTQNPLPDSTGDKPTGPDTKNPDYPPPDNAPSPQRYPRSSSSYSMDEKPLGSPAPKKTPWTMPKSPSQDNTDYPTSVTGWLGSTNPVQPYPMSSPQDTPLPPIPPVYPAQANDFLNPWQHPNEALSPPLDFQQSPFHSGMPPGILDTPPSAFSPPFPQANPSPPGLPGTPPIHPSMNTGWGLPPNTGQVHYPWDDPKYHINPPWQPSNEAIQRRNYPFSSRGDNNHGRPDYQPNTAFTFLNHDYLPPESMQNQEKIAESEYERRRATVTWDLTEKFNNELTILRKSLDDIKIDAELKNNPMSLYSKLYYFFYHGGINDYQHHTEWGWPAPAEAALYDGKIVSGGYFGNAAFGYTMRYLGFSRDYTQWIATLYTWSRGQIKDQQYDTDSIISGMDLYDYHNPWYHGVPYLKYFWPQ